MLLTLPNVWNTLGWRSACCPASLICARRRTASITSCRWAYKTNTIFYNKHMFEEYGTELTDGENITWDEFWAICDQLHAARLRAHAVDLGDCKGQPPRCLKAS